MRILGLHSSGLFKSLANQVLERSRILKLSGAAGILKRIETADGQVITPFFALSYTRFWEAAEINAELTEELEGLVFKANRDPWRFRRRNWSGNRIVTDGDSTRGF